MRTVALALICVGTTLAVSPPAAAQDSALVRYAAELQRADRLLPVNRRDYFDPGSRLVAWAQALAAVVPPPALAAAHRRLLGYSREYAQQQSQAASAPTAGIDACTPGRATPDQTCSALAPPADGQGHFDRASHAHRQYVVVRREIARALHAAGLTPPDTWLSPALK
jgi:hypothetical protein